MKAIYKHLDLGLLIARIGMGAGFIYYHGWAKLMGGPERWEGLGGAMARYGIEFWPTFWGFMAAFSESNSVRCAARDIPTGGARSMIGAPLDRICVA